MGGARAELNEGKTLRKLNQTQMGAATLCWIKAPSCASEPSQFNETKTCTSANPASRAFLVVVIFNGPLD